MVNFQEINARALASGLIFQLFPHAKKYGHSFRVGNLQGESGDSLWIDSQRGCWKDHSTGQAGGDLISLYAAREGIGQGAAKQRLGELLGGYSHAAQAPKTNTVKHANSGSAIKLWKETGSITGTQAERYTQSRGLTAMPPSLRFHPNCYHGPTQRTYPAMIAAITRWPDNTPHAVHRTFLSGNRKADIEPNKMILGPVSGGAVRLGFVTSVLIVAEGIETALSAQQATGIPAWAVLSTSNYKTLILPDTVREIIVAADHDPAGIKAAQEAAELWARRGHTVKIALPPMPDTDFNDLLMKEYSDDQNNI